jgi:20S proteasome subunit alpha 5
VGICTSEGVVIAVEKRLLSPLQEPGSVEKIFEVDSHIGCAMSGLSADARTLVDHARSESQYHHFTFNEPMPVESLTQAVCDLALNFGEGDDEAEATMARPFGVALLVAGWDHRGPVLYHTDPSGTFTRFDAKAIGAGSEGAQTALQEQYHKNLTLVEAETMAITVLKQVMEEKLDATNVEVASVRMPPPKPDVPLTAACHYVPGAKNAPQFALYNQAQLQEALARVAAAAASS